MLSISYFDFISLINPTGTVDLTTITAEGLISLTD